MARKDGVLILTQEIDPHSDAVIEELTRRKIPVWRVHTADFPLNATLTATNDARGL